MSDVEMQQAEMYRACVERLDRLEALMQGWAAADAETRAAYAKADADDRVARTAAAEAHEAATEIARAAHQRMCIAAEVMASDIGVGGRSDPDEQFQPKKPETVGDVCAARAVRWADYLIAALAKAKP